jgi:hypothetical protein
MLRTPSGCRHRGAGSSELAQDLSQGTRLRSGSLLALVLLFSTGSLFAQAITFSVGADEPLTYPGTISYLPDEHTTFIPKSSLSRGVGGYLVFAAGAIKRGKGGALVLETQDLRHFEFARGYHSPVLFSPLDLGRQCRSGFDPEFDLNYAAPGSVLHDPTGPPGSYMMIYEAENHCPGAVFQNPYYATVGFARSSDFGRTWPAPIDTADGGPNRHVVLRDSVPEPTTPENPPVPIGNPAGSAFVDTTAQGSYLYVTYLLIGPGDDGLVRVARAKLGSPNGRLEFEKWYQGAFSQPGISGLDSAALARGCPGFQFPGDISYNDDLRRYFMTVVCISTKKDGRGVSRPYQAGWYFSTATSLDLQNWTPPQLIANSLFPVRACASGGDGLFDGWYPSIMSPGAEPGHITNTGRIFFLNGCITGQRRFMSRTFTIVTHGATSRRR